MNTPNYLRTKLNVVAVNKHSDGSVVATMKIVPLPTELDKERWFTPTGGGDTVDFTIWKDSPLLPEIERGKTFFLDLIPVEQATAVGRG